MRKKDQPTDDERTLFRRAMDTITPHAEATEASWLSSSSPLSSSTMDEAMRQVNVQLERMFSQQGQPESHHVSDLIMQSLNAPKTTVQPSHFSPPVKEVTSEEPLLYVGHGVQHKVTRKLKRGQYPHQAELDLHGMTVEQAYDAVCHFLHAAHDKNYKCVLIIHGKSHGHLGKAPILKNEMNRYLRDREDVIAFCSASPKDGGTGALYVLLKSLL